jgi:hypothetical protein
VRATIGATGTDERRTYGMKIAIIPTTGGGDPYRGMEIARELEVDGVHISAYGGGLDLKEKLLALEARYYKGEEGR